jgi:hypothetical protein
LANKAVKRATQRRTGGIQSMRGKGISLNLTHFKLGIETTAQSKPTPRVRKTVTGVADNDWLKQQKQR